MLQRICLNEFFENNRPLIKDVALIVRVVCGAVLKNKRNISFEMEDIYYDRQKEKVFLKQVKRQVSHDDVCVFMERLCRECRHAGKEVYEYAVMLNEIVRLNNIEDVMSVTEVYIKGEQRKKNIFLFLFVAGISICEIIVLLLCGFSFY